MPGVKTEVGTPGPEAGAARYGPEDEPRSGGPGVRRAAGIGPGTFLGDSPNFGGDSRTGNRVKRVPGPRESGSRRGAEASRPEEASAGVGTLGSLTTMTKEDGGLARVDGSAIFKVRHYHTYIHSDCENSVTCARC